MSQSIAIITDSTCNIPPEMAAEHHLYVVPQHLIWGMDDLLDLKDIVPHAFYERLTRDTVHPKTSQPPAAEFVNYIDQAKRDGASEIVIITISQKLSGTYASAMQAKDMVDVPVHIYDSRCVGMGLGWQVIVAARARDRGADAPSVIAAADNARQRLAMVLTVDTLEYLYRGGRIGGAQKLLGTALNLKPQLVVNPETGVIDPGERTRTRTKGIDSMYRAFFSKMDTSQPLHIAVHHAAAEAEGQAVMERVRQEFNPKELFLNELTPVLGTHGGPGTLALCGYYGD